MHVLCSLLAAEEDKSHSAVWYLDGNKLRFPFL